MSAALLAVVAMVIVVGTAMYWPLRNAHMARGRGPEGVDALELARDAKLGELHDLELDFHLGKLSDQDYRALNETLRAEAVEAMRRSGR